jgi:hypothetical protein
MRFLAAVAVALWLFASASASPVVLKDDRWQIQVDPRTLQTDATTNDGRSLPLSAAADSIDATQLDCSPTSAHWQRGDVTIHVELRNHALSFGFVTTKPGTITWPIYTAAAPAKALILPTYEGAYVPADDADWQEFLPKQSPMDTTSGLIMPFWGVDLGDATLTYLIENPFNNDLAFSTDSNRMALKLTHEFTPNQQEKTFGIIVQLTDASPIAPAKAYRQYMIEHNQFVPMSKKIEQTPNANRLLGAAQIYVWGDSILSRYDVTHWQDFCKALESDVPFAKELLHNMSEEARTQVHLIATTQWPGDYAENVVAQELSSEIQNDFSESRKSNVTDNCLRLVNSFPGMFADVSTWGDGVSTKMLDRLHDAGLDHLCITTGDLYSARFKPQVAKRADELGYLFGPYDSYDSVHKPGDPDSWETAQFDQALYDNGAMIKRDGTPRYGFKKKGFHLSPIAVWPYVQKRVNDLSTTVPFTSWFMDCDAFGDLCDDYSPVHPATMAQDAQARCDRMKWIASAHGAVVGSEGGSAFAAGAIHFAQGMMTPVIGWGDPDLTDKQSPYYLGGYWPPDGPAFAIKQVPLKPYYVKFFYDPRFRLPLYETVFHDSVVATHEWSSGSLKFKDQTQTMELLELLYNVPPLYHLNLAELKKWQARIKSHCDFFSPLHRQLALLPMTDFEWLTPDRLVQRTTFADKTALLANFSDAPYDSDGITVPARSVVSVDLTTKQLQSYSPAK